MKSQHLICDLKDLGPKAKVALYGAGASGIFVLKHIKKNRPDIQVSAFIDDFKAGELEGTSIRRLEEIADDNIILITTSYWREVEQALENSQFTYFVVDLLSGETDCANISRTLNGHEINFYTPNKYLLQVSENFETIEKCTVAWIDTFEEDAVFYDIGASSGIYALYASILKKTVTVAIEPDAQNFAIAEMNHYLNRNSMANRFISLNIGLGDEASILELRCQDYLAGAHGKVFEMRNRNLQKEMKIDHVQHALVDTLDHVVSRYQLPKPNYIKIDVDGAETSVLSGAIEVLQGSDVRQVMIEIEIDLFEEINEKMSKLGFLLRERYSIEEIIGGEINGVHNYLFQKS